MKSYRRLQRRNSQILSLAHVQKEENFGYSLLMEVLSMFGFPEGLKVDSPTIGKGERWMGKFTDMTIVHMKN